MESNLPWSPAPDPAPQPAKSRADEWLPRVVGAIAAAPAVLGVVKTLLETSTAQPFTLSDAAYYVGWAALGAIIGAWWGAMAAGAVNWLLTEVFGQEEEQIEGVVIGVAILVFALCTIGFAVAADPPADDSGALWRVLGIVTVVAGCAGYAALRSSKSKA